MHFGSMQRSSRSNTVECLEVFDAAQHAQHTYSQCRYCLGKPSGYALGIGAAPEGYGGESDAGKKRRRGGYGEGKFPS